MIAYFPAPYPDELWYSVCGRFSDRMRFGTETGVMRSLYGNRHAIAIVDLPHRLGALVAQLPDGHPCTVDEIINNHSFLPYYSPFLLTTTYAAARRFMADDTNSTVRIKCGACTHRVRPPKFFRSCPLCDRENRENLSETYWRRLFQLPGVEVCPIHKVFLEFSTTRLNPLANRHKYFSAGSSDLGTAIHKIDPEDKTHQLLVALTHAVEWLINQKGLNPGLEALHERYRQVLRAKGFATRAGSIRMDDLSREVLSFYGGPKPLEIFQSSLPDGKSGGWLGHMLRKTNTAAPPLRHLLLLTALRIDLQEFFFPQQSSPPVGSLRSPTGPWPCLNRICEHYRKDAINHADLHPADTNGNRHLIIKCSDCGFAYQIREGAENPVQANRVIDYGPVWKNKLKQLWGDATVTLRQMAKTLGVDPKTVKQRAAELRLPFPRSGKRPVTKCGLYVPKAVDKSKCLQTHRAAWLELRDKHPAAGTKQLRALAPALYAWLYRVDKAWLATHRPKIQRPVATRTFVDWAQRDGELAGQIATVAAQIKNGPGKPRRVTVTAIGRLLGKQALFEAALAKLPLTRSVINSVLESGEDFAVRRVRAAAARLRQTEGAFPRWRLVQAAGLHYRMERQPNVKLALDYEMRPFVRVVILKDGDPTPWDAIQPMSRKLIHPIRPGPVVPVAS